MSRIVHALVACYRGRIGYKEACFSLDLFINMLDVEVNQTWK